MRSPSYSLASLLGLLVLTGCGVDFSSLNSPGSSRASISGTVYGGATPITGAHVYLLAVNTTGYGGPGIAASAANASLSLLNSANTNLSDSLGAYVLTLGPNGSFAITGDYKCPTTTTQVYLYALGGNTGSGNNPSAGLMAAIGNCSSLGASLHVTLNEISTVAAAYALAGFASDATHISSSGTPLAQTGIANAFLNVTNLEDLSTGNALAVTPAGNGIAPQATVNTIGNILASCVDTTGSVAGPTNPTNCYTLFSNASSAGTTGTVPTDTATAAINLAHNPYPSAAGVTALYSLQPATGAPFATALSTAPSNFSLIVVYSSAGGLGTGYGQAPYQLFVGVAIDAQGNVWVPNTGADSIVELTNTGVPLSSASGFSNAGISPAQLVLDQSGNAWVRSGLSTSATKMSSGGVASVVYTAPSTYSISGITIDALGHPWVALSASHSSQTVELNTDGSAMSPAVSVAISSAVTAFDGAGSLWNIGSTSAVVIKNTSTTPSLQTVPLTGGGFVGGAEALAFDHSANLWITDDTITEFNHAGMALSPSTGYYGGGVPDSTTNQQGGVAIDGSGNVWVTNYADGTVTGFSPAGVALNSGFATRLGVFSPTSVAIDGSGNVWVSGMGRSLSYSPFPDIPYSGLVEFVGAGTPVITPLPAGLPTTPTSDGSSNLGTRP